MKHFFQTFFAVLVGLSVWSILSIVAFVFFCVFFAASLASSKPMVSIPKNNSVLEINFTGEISDRAHVDVSNFNSIINEKEVLGINTLVRCLQNAASDDRIGAVFLNIGSPDCGFETACEIRRLLVDFRKSEKPVYVYASGLDNMTFFVASAADKIFISPGSDIYLRGLSMQSLYFKNALDKMGVNMQVIRHGKFKSAVEPYLSDKMSEENRTQSSVLINDIWYSVAVDISNSLNISVDTLNSWADNLSLVGNPDLSEVINIIAEPVTEDQAKKQIQSLIGQDTKKDFECISEANYNSFCLSKSSEMSDQIAILYACGEITRDASSDVQTINCPEFCKAVDEIIADDNIKGVVLRINSPGGSADDAETIYRKLDELHQTKPIIVSMGDYAASGGYYIACAADSIFAMPSTITGSIGVFGVVPCVRKALQNTVNVNVETVTTNKNSDFGSILSPLSDVSYAALQRTVENVYSTFLTRVSQARNMTTEQVDSIAQGRVWSGFSALNIGLIDNFGDMNYSISACAELANISNYSICEYPASKNSLSFLMEDFASSKIKSVLLDWTGDNMKLFNEVDRLLRFKGVKCLMNPVIIR